MKNLVKTSSLIQMIIFLAYVTLFFALKNLPLLSTLGLEAANLFVIIFGPLFFLASAIYPLNENDRSYVKVFSTQFIWLVVHFSAFSLLLFINGTSLKSCSSGSGFIPFIIASFPPLLLNISLGSLLSVVNISRLVKVSICILTYLTYYLWITWCWWKEASFRIFTHASFLMSSDLLQGDSLSVGVILFRLSTLMLCAFLMLFGTNIWAKRRAKMFDSNKLDTKSTLLVMALLLIAALITQSSAYKNIGKWRKDLKKDYKLLIENDVARIFADPSKTSLENAQQISDEAKFYFNQLQRVITVSKKPVTIWLHHSSKEKLLYTGAKNVHFALPKHREIHISGYKSPHEVLGHELAHIYLGEKSKNLFGALGGRILPNMALTEGLAVALTQELNINDGLSILEQACAMHKNGIAIDLANMFSTGPLSFASIDPQTSYIFAGAFLRLFIDRLDDNKKATAINNLANSGDITTILGDLDKEKAFAIFTNTLNNTQIPTYATYTHNNYLLHGYFTQESIITKNCKENRKESANFKTALINADQNKLLSIIKKQKPNNIYLLLSTTNTLAATKPQVALSLFNKAALDLRKLSNDQEKIIHLKKLQLLIANQKWSQARNIIQSMNFNTYPPAVERMLIITKEILDNYQDSELDKATLALLHSFDKDKHNHTVNFVYHTANNLKDDTTKSIYIKYILARIFLNNNEYKKSLGLLMSILNHKSLLSDPIVKEATTMFAKASLALNNIDTAKNTFNHLIKLSNTNGEILYYKDTLNRY